MKVALIAVLAVLPVTGLESIKGDSPLPPWTLKASRDSFVINVNGNAMGFAVLAVEKLPKGFRVTESTRIGTMVEQTTEILLDVEQRILSVLQTGRLQGQEARIELRYGPKRVTGSAAMPAPGGPKSHAIDMAVPDDVVDDNLLQVLFGALPWSPNVSYTLPVFSAGKNGLTEMKLTAVGEEAVSLAGGAVDAYRVEMRGDLAAVNVWVSKAAPQRVLRIAPVGAPFEMVRVN